jgi:hypothetical protein
MDKVTMIERRPDSKKISLRFDSGWQIEVGPVEIPDCTPEESIQRIIDRWSGRVLYPDMIECWSDQMGPEEGYGHIWIDLSACVGFDTQFGPLGRMMEVQLSESAAPRWFWLRRRTDMTEEEQTAELFKRWRRARGERA